MEKMKMEVAIIIAMRKLLAFFHSATLWGTRIALFELRFLLLEHRHLAFSTSTSSSTSIVVSEPILNDYCIMN